MSGVDVGDADQFPDGRLCIVRIEQHEVGIMRWGDRAYAVRNFCPHQGGPACAQLSTMLTASASGAPEAGSRPVVRCGWHGWEFDVETGKAVWSDRYRVKTWPAKIVDGRMLVEIRGRPSAGERAAPVGAGDRSAGSGS